MVQRCVAALPLAMFSVLVLFLFRFPFVFSTVLFYFLWLGQPYIPLFVLSRCLLHLCPCLLIYSPCVFFYLLSLSFAVSSDCLFPLLIFFHFLILFCFISSFLLLLLSLYACSLSCCFVLCTSLFRCLDSPFPIFLSEFAF